ncbi:uncharacterized protein K02A2.6-like [Stylophora pistillata]|nr:uncharacterized protein K02A2.6-like [Stylophora pistillata]
MQRVQPPSEPRQDVAIDVLGPLPSVENLLVVIGYYSRFFEVVTMHSTTSRKLMEALTPIFTQYGYPFSLKSDNAPQFVSEEFENFLATHGIQRRKSPPLWPQANGEVDCQNRTLLKSLKVAEVEGKKWKDELDKFLLAYRTTPHSSTGATPAFLMFGRELKSKLPELCPNKSVLDESTRYRDWNQKLAGKMYGDKQRHAVDNPIAPGDKVLLKNTKQSGKLAANFEPNPYTVQTKEGQELPLKSTDGTVQRRNGSFVKPYKTPQEPDSSIGAETLADRVVPPSVADTATTTEPKSRPSRTVRMPPKFKDFVLDR